MFCNFHFSDDQSRWQLLEEGQIIAHFLGRSYDLHIYFGIFCTGCNGAKSVSLTGLDELDSVSYMVTAYNEDASEMAASNSLVTVTTAVWLLLSVGSLIN